VAELEAARLVNAQGKCIQPSHPLIAEVAQRDWAPATLSQLERPYRLGLGEMQLDLTHLKVPPGRHDLVARVGVGQLKVTVPYGLNVIATGDVGIGEVHLLEHFRSNGGKLSIRDPQAEFSSDQPQLVLRLHTDVGQVEVVRAPAA